MEVSLENAFNERKVVNSDLQGLDIMIHTCALVDEIFQYASTLDELYLTCCHLRLVLRVDEGC